MKLQRNDSLETRIIKSFVDILILRYLKMNEESSGYEILKHLHSDFDVLFSPGTVYHAIYVLERKNLIRSDGDCNGCIYTLTEEGEKSLSDTVESSLQIQNLVSNILSRDQTILQTR